MRIPPLGGGVITGGRGYRLGMVRCAIVGHRYRFAAAGEVMTWTCARCGHEGGRKRYPTAADASRYAAAFDREDREDLGRRAPLVGLLPLRIVRALRGGAARRQ